MLGTIWRQSNVTGLEHLFAPGKSLLECPIGDETGVLGRVPVRLHPFTRRHPAIDDPKATRLECAVTNGFG